MEKSGLEWPPGQRRRLHNVTHFALQHECASRIPACHPLNDEGPALRPGLRGNRPAGEDQNPLAFRRPLLTTLPLHAAVGTAAPRIAALTSAAVAPGREALYSAAAPVTCGVAIEVPL